jgi:hypothetical protein
MVAGRLLTRIETNWERIAQKVIDARNDNPSLAHYRNLSDDEIRERVRDFTSNLAVWLTERNEERLAAHFQRLGARRWSQAMPLPELLLKITIIRQAIRAYASEQNLNLTPLEIYEELELLRAMANYFDFVTYNVALGYWDAGFPQAASASPEIRISYS